MLRAASSLEHVLDFRDERLVLVGFIDGEELAAGRRSAADCAQNDPLRWIVHTRGNRLGEQISGAVGIEIEHDHVGTVLLFECGGDLGAIGFVDITIETR